jgi:hypothetical protein
MRATAFERASAQEAHMSANSILLIVLVCLASVATMRGRRRWVPVPVYRPRQRSSRRDGTVEEA